MSVTGGPVVAGDLNTYGDTALGILWYNVFATNDAIDKLGRRPYDNFDRVYSGTGDPILDAMLNAGIKRYKVLP